MIPLRRLLLKGSTTLPLAALLAGGLLQPSRLLAASWNHNAFTARQTDEALKAYGAVQPSPAGPRDIAIHAPETAENGGKVDIEVSTTLPGAVSIAVFADKNAYPLCASIDFLPPALPFVKLQAKLLESTRIRAVVRSGDGKFHVAFREIKVTQGGCGA